MTDLTRFNPLRGLARFDPFGRDMEDLFKGFFLTPLGVNPLVGGQIPVDVTENDQAYTVRAELPGLKKDDIQVAVEGNQVSISAETKKENEEKKGDQVVLRECYYGRQFRSFTLPQAVSDSETTARYADGVLELVLPKKGAAASSKIKID